MALVNLRDILKDANENSYAVGAFNTYNMEITKAIIAGAEAQNAPVILQISQASLQYAGFEYLLCLAKCFAEKSSVPVAVHLDHTADLNLIKKFIEMGYASVTIDGGRLSFEENVKLTKNVVEIIKAKGGVVEGEFGVVCGKEDVFVSKRGYTEPQKAKEFVERTNVDVLAISIGNVHGPFKFKEDKNQLDIKRLIAIKKLTNIPLALHGASVIPREILQQAQEFGAVLGTARGVDEKELKRAVKNGVNKVNVNTDLHLAFSSALRKTLMQDTKLIDVRKLLMPSWRLVQKVVEDRIKLLGSSGKA